MIKKRVVIEKANRLYQMPPDILSMGRLADKKSLGRRLTPIDLASFNWPIEHDHDFSADPKALLPAAPEQLASLRVALAEFYQRQYQVKLNPEKEIYLGGSISSLIFALGLAYLEAGDLAFVPQIGLPLYRKVVTACSAEPISYPITQKNNWSPDLDRLSTKLGRVGQLLFLNSPHNPTGSELDETQLAYLIALAARENILIVNDAAYQSVPLRRPLSLLSLAGGKKVGVEVGSFAYHFGLPQMPVGFVVGNRETIATLRMVATLLPPTIPTYAVNLALAGMHHFPSEKLKAMRKELAASEAEATYLLDKLSLENCSGSTVPFIWAKIERKAQATTAARILYRRSRILSAAGSGFGENGQGYLRFSLTAKVEDYTKAHKRIKKGTSLRARIGEEI